MDYSAVRGLGANYQGNNLNNHIILLGNIRKVRVFSLQGINRQLDTFCNIKNTWLEGSNILFSGNIFTYLQRMHHLKFLADF